MYGTKITEKIPQDAFQAPGKQLLLVTKQREAAENAAPTLARYGYTGSGVEAVAGGSGKFRVRIFVWGKRVAFGRYKDIHVACCDAGYEYDQGDGGKA
jgi:hypothetical protein